MYNQKITSRPVQNNINSLDFWVHNSKKKKQNISNNGSTSYTISFLTDEERLNFLKPEDYKNKYGFVIGIVREDKNLKGMKTLLYSDGTKFIEITPKYNDTATYIHQEQVCSATGFCYSILDMFIFINTSMYYPELQTYDVWAKLYDSFVFNPDNYPSDKYPFRLYEYSYDLFKMPTFNSETITHLMPISDNIENYHIGDPVFLSDDNNIYYQYDTGNHYMDFKKIETEKDLLEHPTDQLFKVQRENNNKFIGVCVKIIKPGVKQSNNKIFYNSPCIIYATHGDYLFKVNDNRNYEVGDIIDYNGDTVISGVYNNNKIVGTITSKPSFTTEYVSVFKQ